MKEFSKIESLEYLVRNEIRISEWKEDAMYMTCRDIITLNANSNPGYEKIMNTIKICSKPKIY